MKQLTGVFLILLLSTLACAQTRQATSPQPIQIKPTLPGSASTSLVGPTLAPTALTSPGAVPAEYSSMYGQLETALQAVQNDYPLEGGQAPLFAAELSYANGNIGEGLLNPQTLTLVHLELDELSQMGVRGVVLAIKFPMVEPNFPRSAEYLQFFKQVADDVRQHNMKLLVESGALFSGTAFSPLQVDWSQYPNATAFRQAEIHQLETIAQQIHPDYLQIANEPTTTAMLTKFVDTPADYTAFIRNAVQTIQLPAGTLLGAGAGTWENQAYVTSLFGINGLDFIDLHVYPVGQNGTLLRLAGDLAQKAHAAGKRVVISETWLYKTETSSAFQASDFTTVIGRDVFSFWEPLDAEFIQDMTGIARSSGIEFVSFFWVREFYAYLDYDQYHTLPLTQVNPVINQVSVTNSKDHVLSPLGVFFQDWISKQSR